MPTRGPNLSGIDPQTGRLTRLFHPRQDVWSDHFRYDGAVLLGITDVGRTTADVLGINHADRAVTRRLLIEAGHFLID